MGGRREGIECKVLFGTDNFLGQRSKDGVGVGCVPKSRTFGSQKAENVKPKRRICGECFWISFLCSLFFLLSFLFLFL